MLRDSTDVSVFLTTFRSGHKLFLGVGFSKGGFIKSLRFHVKLLVSNTWDSGLLAGRVLDLPAMQACALWVNEGAIV